MIAGQFHYSWRVATITVCMLLVLNLVVYRETVVYLVGLWSQLSSGNFAHGFLVLGISAYLILDKRHELSRLAPSIYYRAIPAIFVAALVWLVAAISDVQSIQAAGLLLVVLSIVWVFLGRQVTWVLLFPILFLGFAIPIWFPLLPLLQELTVEVVFGIIRLLGVPALRQDIMIVLPAGSLSVEETCSGLRYLMAALTLGTLYAYLNYTNIRTRLVVVCISAGAAVLANLLRVLIVVYLAYVSDMQHPLVSDHVMLGWYLFGGLVAVLLFTDARLHRHHHSVTSIAGAERNAVAAGDSDKGAVKFLLAFIACAALLFAGPAVVYRLHNQTQLDSGNVKLKLTAGVSGWTGPVDSRNDWMPDYRGAVTRKQDYVKDSARVTVYVGYYPSQRQGEELVNALNRISNNDTWRTHYAHAGVRQNGDRYVLEQLIERNDGTKKLVWYWYRVAGRLTTNKYVVKVLQVMGLMLGKPQAFVVAVATDMGEDIEHTRSILGEYLSVMGPALADVVTESR